MSFEHTIREIIENNDCSSVEELFEEFEIRNFRELESLYREDRENFMIKFCNFGMSTDNFIDQLLTVNRDFLRSFSEPVKDYINFCIKSTNKSVYDKFPRSYFDWEDKKFNYEDFTIGDLLVISRTLKEPPLPLTRSSPNEENFKDKKHILRKIFNESLYKTNSATIRLFNMVLEGKEKGDFKVYTDNEELYIHSWILLEYPLFERIINSPLNKNNNSDAKYSLKMDTSSEAFKLFVGFLYGVYPDLELYSEEIIIDLLILADYINIDFLTQMCSIYLDDKDLKMEHKVKKAHYSISDWFSRIGRHLRISDELIENSKITMEEHIRSGKREKLLDLALEIKKKLIETNDQNGRNYVHFEFSGDNESKIRDIFGYDV